MVESVVIQSAPTGPDAPGADPNANTPPANEPVKLAGKFDSAADLEKAYIELQSKLGQPKAPEATPPAPKPGETPPAPNAEADAAKAAVENAGLSFEKYTSKYAEKGELEASDYEELASKGIPKAMVDAFIEGQKAVVDRRTSELRNAAFEVAGNEGEYTKMVEWAAQNMSDAAKKAFNDLVESGDPAKVRIAVTGLKADYAKGGGAEPNNIDAQRPGGQSRYESLAEMMKDMGDPRYENDPAFRAAVERKLERSDIL